MPVIKKEYYENGNIKSVEIKGWFLDISGSMRFSNKEEK